MSLAVNQPPHHAPTSVTPTPWVSGGGATAADAARRVTLRASDAGSLAALAILVLGFASPYACTRLQILLTIILVLHRSPVWLPALILLQFTPTDFRGGMGAAMDVQYERFEGLTVYVFGFPLTPNFTLVLAMVVRTIYDIATYPSRFRGVISSWLLMPIAIAVVVSAYNSIFLGLLERVPGWSAPLRTALGSLAVWYGISIAKDWHLFKGVLVRRVSLISGAFFFIAFFMPLVNIQYCYLIPFGVACAAGMLLGKDMSSLAAKPLAVSILTMSALNYVLAKRASEAVIEAVKRVGGGVVSQTTHTVMAALPLGLMLVRPRLVSPRNAVISGGLAAVFFILYVAAPFYLASLNLDVDVRANTAATFYERAVYKLFHERSSIWRGKIKLISNPPYVFVPPSRVSTWITASGDEYRFSPSAHNMVLEHFASEGMLSGAINLLVVFVGFAAALRVWLATPDTFAGVLATTFIIGMMWNGFGVGHCVDTAASFLLMTTAGGCLVAAARPGASPPGGLAIGRPAPQAAGSEAFPS
jgi:hypothetical protein